MHARVPTLDGLRLRASQNQVRMKVRRKEQLKNNWVRSVSETQLEETQDQLLVRT